MSKLSSFRSRFMVGANQTDKDIRAVDPPLGTGNDRPIGISSLSVVGGGPDRGAITLISWPAFTRCWPKLDI